MMIYRSDNARRLHEAAKSKLKLTKRLSCSRLLSDALNMNINHWVSDLRKIARNADIREEDGKTPVTKKFIKQFFNRENFREQFKDGLSPQEAFNDEMDCWKEN